MLCGQIYIIELIFKFFVYYKILRAKRWKTMQKKRIYSSPPYFFNLTLFEKVEIVWIIFPHLLRANKPEF